MAAGRFGRDGEAMLFAEAVSISGEVVALILLFLLVALLAAVTVVAGTIVAARRYARTRSPGSAASVAVGVSIEVVVLVMAIVAGYPPMIGVAGVALIGTAVAYTAAKRRPTAP